MSINDDGDDIDDAYIIAYELMYNSCKQNARRIQGTPRMPFKAETVRRVTDVHSVLTVCKTRDERRTSVRSPGCVGRARRKKGDSAPPDASVHKN
eukprot:2183010-Pyramimonas_sp.AAC.1